MTPEEELKAYREYIEKLEAMIDLLGDEFFEYDESGKFCHSGRSDLNALAKQVNLTFEDSPLI